MLAARTPHNRLVHLPVPPGSTAEDLAGTVRRVRITAAHPWFLTGALVDEAD